MTDNPQTLWDRPAKLPHNRTNTSREASRSHSLGKVQTERQRILALAISRGCEGLIRDDCETELGMTPGTYCPRIRELIDDGELVPKTGPHGRPVRQPTQRGRNAEVLVAQRFAKPKLEESA